MLYAIKLLRLRRSSGCHLTQSTTPSSVGPDQE